MKKLTLLFIVFFIVFTKVFAQERIDVIYLKNGDILKGIIIENVPNDYVRIELMGGSILTYKYSDILKFTKEYRRQDFPEKKENDDKLGNTIILQQQQQQQQQQTPQQNIQTPQQTVETGLTDAQKLALYENQKKSGVTAGLLSFLVSSTGHAYAGNWGKGLLFLLGRVGSYAAATQAKTQDEQSGWLLLMVGLSIWEIFDAVAEVDRYNQRAYNSIYFGTPNIGLNLAPMKDGLALNLSYRF